MNTHRPTTTTTDRHAIIACDSETRKITVVSVHEDYDRALAAYQPLDDERFAAEGDHAVAWYAVRSVADPIVANAICAQFKLGPAQAAVLTGIRRASDHRTGTGRRTAASTYDVDAAIGRGSRVRFEQISQVAKGLQARGLVVVYGVAYGPKTYRPTSLGRLLSEARTEGVETAPVAA